MAQGFTLSMTLRAVDRATRPLQRIGRAVQQVSRQTGLDRVGRRAQRLSRSMGNVSAAALAMGRKVALVSGALGGAAFGVTGHFAKWADHVVKTASRLGISTDALQRWRYAAELSGVSSEALEMSLQRMGRRAAEAAHGQGEAAGAFRYLGVALRDEMGNVRGAEDIFADTMDALARVGREKGEEVRNAVAQKIFDREGVSLVQMGDAAQIKALGDELAAAGRIKPFEELQAGVDHLDNLTRLKTAVHDLTLTLGSELLPRMDEVVRKLTEWIKKAKPSIVTEIQKAFADLGAVLDWIGNAFGRIGEAVGSFLDWLESTHPAVAEWIGRLREGAEGMGAFRLAVAGVVSWLGAKFVFAVARSIVSMFLFGGSVIYAAVRTAILAAALIGQGAWSLASAFWRLPRTIGFAAFALKYFTLVSIGNAIAGLGWLGRAIGGAARAVWGFTASLLLNPVFLIGAAIAAAVAGIGYAAYLIYKYWRDIPAFFAGVWQDIKAWFLTPFGEWDKAIAEAVLGAWKAVISGLKGLPAWFMGIWDRVEAAFDVAGWIEALRSWSLTAAMQGWVAGAVSWFQRTWSSIEAAFDVAGWIEALRSWSLTAAMQGWVAGAVSWFQRTWSSIEAAFDVAGWIEALRSWSLTAVMQGWVAGAVSWFQRTWSSIEAAFDVAGWIEALRSWSLTAVMQGWVAGAVSWFQRTWSSIEAAFDVAGWIEALRSWSLTAVMQGWVAGAVSWFQRTWSSIEAAFDVAGWIEALRSWSLTAAMQGWVAGAVSWFQRTWSSIEAAFDVAGWIEALKGFGLLDTVKGWFAQVVPWVTKTWGEIRAAIGIEALVNWLETFDLWQIGMDWVDGLWAGMVAGWGEFVAWVSSAIDHLMGPINWLMRQFGVSDQDEAASIAAANENAPARIRALAAAGPAEAVPSALGGLAPPVPSAIGPGSEALQGGVSVQQIAEIVRVVVGGEVRVAFENSPKGMRVKSVRSDNPDIDIDVTAGYSMAGS